jgi:glycyl-tRNA synthetase beta chain
MVLAAKLKDAEFFYSEDMKTKLEEKVERLKKVTFLGKLGTLFEKTNRLVALTKIFAEDLKLSTEEKQNLERAAFLSKADLVTHMVYEFPELQGFAGSEYAKREGEPEAVARALKDYYLPTSLQSEDPLELTSLSTDTVRSRRLTGALLGILDKLDTLVGAVGIGLEVSGSQDPYALRRAANGIVMTVFELKKRNLINLSFGLKKLIVEGSALYGEKLKLPQIEISGKLAKLVEERILWLLGNERARDKEFLSGIFVTSSDNLAQVWDKFFFLKTVEGKHPQVLYQAYKIVERTRNILKGAKDSFYGEHPVQDSQLQMAEERALFEAFTELKSRFVDLALAGSYFEATELYASSLYDRISTFFDRVLVNVEDEALKRNRLALMRDINALYTQHIADLSGLTQMTQTAQLEQGSETSL